MEKRAHLQLAFLISCKLGHFPCSSLSLNHLSNDGE